MVLLLDYLNYTLEDKINDFYAHICTEYQKGYYSMPVILQCHLCINLLQKVNSLYIIGSFFYKMFLCDTVKARRDLNNAAEKFLKLLLETCDHNFKTIQQTSSIIY